MKLTWLTDIHLNFLDKQKRNNFYLTITHEDSDAVLISGDIAEAPSISFLLKEMSVALNKPIYFVLGNHDYYHGQVDEVRQEMVELTQAEKLLYWLPAVGMQVLTTNIILVGHDGWADARYGDYANSRIVLNDSHLIADLFQAKIIGKFQLLNKMQQLAERDALQLQENLLLALKQHPKNIIVLTHVPPFKETCLHQGKVSDANWLPYFGSKVMGDLLLRVAKDNPAVEFLVLCGHTHSAAHYQPLVNLLVKAGNAEYYQPGLQELINI
ncbi:MAG: metallophosphoesterase [Legionellales bacterium]|nr:metallophosphoesterase [Legionellales bacterium]